MLTATSFWANMVGFQAVWWACALYGNAGAWASLVWLAAHLVWHRRHANEVLVVLACLSIGMIVDSTLMHTGWLRFNDPSHGLPFWLCVIWACFGATMNHSMQPLQQRIWLATLLGAVGGPMSYYAGTALGRVSFADTTSTLIVLAAVWAVMLPGLLCLSRWLATSQFARTEVTK
ncbi:MAG: DUF2878 domain-containing protein [Methylobacterium sp.]|nr:DUF2878 domain-containing protein [Methylobacterium sp.]